MYLPLKKGVVLHLPLNSRMLCANFGWNWPTGSCEEVENVKSFQTDIRTDGQTDAGRQLIRKLTSGELKSQCIFANL